MKAPEVRTGVFTRTEMNDIETAWIAGLLEGEGCFSPHIRKGRYYARVKLRMNDLDIVKRAQALIGGTIYAEKAGHYCLDFSGDAAIAVMIAILPYMGERRTERISEVLDNILIGQERIC